MGLFDDDYEALLVDWRTPVAQPFYRATPAEPAGVVRRRYLRTRGRQVIDIEDDLLDLAALDDEQRSHLSGEGALLASLASGRTGRMADIVATIQAEQDKVIRSDLDGVLVVEGGPGTGKTVVALHRAAYLLYTHRTRLAKRGVLILGPNLTFMRYIDQVLPSLGETEAVLATVGELYPGVVATGHEPAESERVKGDQRMADVLATAVGQRQWVPDTDLEIVVEKEAYTLTPEVCRRARDRVRARSVETGEDQHNRMRRHFVREILDDLTAQGVARLGAELLGPADVEDVRQEFRSSPAVHDVLDDLWPELTPERFLTDLFRSPERLDAAAPDFTAAERAALVRAPGHPWTPADVPMLDEAAERLGDLDATIAGATSAAVRQRETAAEEFAYVRATMEMQAEYGQLAATPDDIGPVAEMVSGRYRENRRPGPAADSALADREWTYGHVIVDEAQELSAMAWRMVIRRCPARSMTVVGDLAQASAPGGAPSWADALDPYAGGRWRTERLTVNYRTPKQIMALAGDVLAAIDAGLQPPRSVRNGLPPWSRQVDAGELAGVLPDLVAAELRAVTDPAAHDDGEDLAGAGRVAVVVPSARLADVTAALGPLAPGTAAGGTASVLDSRVAVLTVAQAKGLEFDAVIVVDPAGVLAESARGAGDLYVAVTRATRRLGVVSVGPLPGVLARLPRRAGAAAEE
ncbi:UvrD-helicase domain-containing protein [Actinopolymorpha sp. B9G3]|uniref:HelD family protein n=1 Tax=Actinopolymorpha sp. B9G3 TaxID=3158970 RepID=UPI0032D992C1